MFVARLDKIIKKMLNQPNDIDCTELRYVLLAIGCNERRGKGSHTFFPIQKLEFRFLFLFKDL